MSDITLHKDIWLDIFLRLPIKSLVSCACTCKTFKSYIINPHFTAAHLKKSKQNPFFFLRYYYSEERKKKNHSELFGLHLDDGDSSSNWDFNMTKLPLKTHASCFHIVGSCNGVVCLSDDVEGYTNRVYLWNPCIKKYIPLPCPNVTFPSHGAYDMCLGFGFDERANDFKVVRVTYLDDYSYDDPPLVDVYSVKRGSWRFVENSSPKLLIYNMDYSQCFLNGAIHWLGKKRFGTGPFTWAGVVTFNVVDESFGEIALLDSLDLSHRDNLTISSCWGMLAVILVDPDVPYSHHRLHPLRYSHHNKICVWAMKEYGVVDSWTKVLTLMNPMMGLFFKPISFRKNNEILLLSNKGMICSVKQNGSMVKELGKFLAESVGGLYLDLYEESLALFNEGIPTLNSDDEDDSAAQNDELTPEDAEELQRRLVTIFKRVVLGISED